MIGDAAIRKLLELFTFKSKFVPEGIASCSLKWSMHAASVKEDGRDAWVILPQVTIRPTGKIKLPPSSAI